MFFKHVMITLHLFYSLKKNNILKNSFGNHKKVFELVHRIPNLFISMDGSNVESGVAQDPSNSFR